MSDIFSEVDEDLKKEQYSRLWKRFSPFVYTVAGLIVVGTAGYRAYDYWEDQQSKEAGQVFLDAIRLSEDGKHGEAITAFEGLEEGLGGYPMLARLRIATELSAQDKTAEAISLLQEISADSSVPAIYQGLAHIRASYLLMDLNQMDNAVLEVEGLAIAGNPWRYSALEILGVIDYSAGDLASAKARFEEIVNEAGAPGDVVARARMGLDLIAGTMGTTTKEGEN
ncbi:tetratricopeptide repeat protein [Flexibacterium corallicola]|uniref:tetratricopeptide repeat protein n=1 Tax=Flexibacterium corallicola TaxID=3037259 RepID=UPI00286F73CE|nr:tetratricopeptide repeat protein [Pseudovibrio sp. M1P-2-3]